MPDIFILFIYLQPQNECDFVNNTRGIHLKSIFFHGKPYFFLSFMRKAHGTLEFFALSQSQKR